MIVKNMELQNILKHRLKKYPGVEDILLFGSSVRGKYTPGDIDILVLFTTQVSKEMEYEIRKELSQFSSHVSLISKTKKTILDPAFDARESILFEGKSLFSKKTLAEQYGFSSLGMFRYAIKGWSNLQKTKFYYALNGRSGKGGILDLFHAVKFSDSVFLVPMDKIEPMKEFLDSWKITYMYTPILLPERMNHKRFLRMG